MSSENKLLQAIEAYWTNRSTGYSQVNKDELATGQDVRWLQEIKSQLPAAAGLKVLDVGTGPGFFAIILAKAGYEVTAVDYTPAMLDEARANAGAWASNIIFRQMDAQKLEFEDDVFDVVISRNLTWNLPDPKAAYQEWCRVLKVGGTLLNFDANWYLHLFDDAKRGAYQADRAKVQENNLEDHYTCTDIEAMEAIARQVPLSKILRPNWDKQVLEKLGMRQIITDEQVWQRVLAQVEKINYASTPPFMVKAVK